MSARIQRLLDNNQTFAPSLEALLTQDEIDEINDQIIHVEFEQHLEDAEVLVGIATGLESIRSVCDGETDYHQPITQAALKGFSDTLGIDVCYVSTESAVVDTIKRIYRAVKSAIEKALAVVIMWALKFSSRSSNIEERVKARLKRISKLADNPTVKVEVEDNLDQLAIKKRVDLGVVVEVSTIMVGMLDALSHEADRLSKKFIDSSDAKSIIEIEDALDALGEDVIGKFIDIKETDDGYESKDILPGNVRLVFNFKSSTPVFSFRKEENYDDISLLTTLEEVIEAMETVGSKSTFASLARHLKDAKESGVTKALDNRVGKFNTGSNESTYIKNYLALAGRINALSTLPHIRISQYVSTLADHIERLAGVVEKATKE